MLTQADLLLSLRLLGVHTGERLLVHSALTAPGPVDGGADAVIAALLDAVGPDGTIMMSTLSGWSAPFDPDVTPSAVGWLSERFRTRPGVCRSRHPVHSVAAYGRDAAYLTAGHDLCMTGCGAGTPYDKLRALGGRVLLLGVDLDRCTILHALEERADSPYLVTYTIPAPVYQTGGGTFTLTKFPPGHRDFKGLAADLRRAGILTEGRFGHARLSLLDVPALYDWGERRLADDPFTFLCGNPRCEFCQNARHGIENAVGDR